MRLRKAGGQHAHEKETQCLQEKETHREEQWGVARLGTKEGNLEACIFLFARQASYLYTCIYVHAVQPDADFGWPLTDISVGPSRVEA